MAELATTRGAPRVNHPPRRPASAAWRFDLGPDAYAILECPSPAAGHLRTGLTPAERHVVALITRGLSNADIARQRGSAPRTVANQAASIFRKLRVGSRLELGALLARGERGRAVAPPRTG
jgi:DNA-binding NarL/FixJ family response regulator